LPRPSLRSFFAMTNTMYLRLAHSCHREGEARGDPLAHGNRRDKPVRVTRDTMDCRVSHLGSFLAMTNTMYFCLTHPCHCEGEVCGDPLAHGNRTDNPPTLLETRWIAASVTCVPSSQCTNTMYFCLTHPCHREPLAGVAIHWLTVTEQTTRPHSSRHDGLPRRTFVLLGMTK
jgi:hypothetical protein